MKLSVFYILQTLSYYPGLWVVVAGLAVIFILSTLTRRGISRLPADAPLLNTDTHSPQGPTLVIAKLKSQQLSELKRLVTRKDQLQLAIFFASHHCDLEDVAKIQESLHGPTTQFLGYLDQLPETSLNNLRQSPAYESLTENQKMAIGKLAEQQPRLLDQNFIRRFGGIVFMENFIMYQHLCHTDPAVFYIPKGNELRFMFDTFAKTGLAIVGQAIPFADRLRSLSWSELQMLAGKVGISRFIQDKNEAITVLSEKPETESAMAGNHPVTDFYQLLGESWDITQVEMEWRAYEAFAEVLVKSQQKERVPEVDPQEKKVLVGEKADKTASIENA